jgi:ferredoxin-type protein NapG
MADERRIDRKDFFKEGPLSLIRAFMDGAQEDPLPMPRDEDIPLLRPPGAVPEAAFLELCGGLGACADVCPANAILMLPREDETGRDSPLIQPAIAACVICEDLSCMKVCPSGALKLVERDAIRIGIAKIDHDECLAWTDMDVSCRDCVDKCPVGESAIRFETRGESHGPVMGSGCVGCGVCEFHCPSYPEAIRVFELPEAGAGENSA